MRELIVNSMFFIYFSIAMLGNIVLGQWIDVALCGLVLLYIILESRINGISVFKYS